MLRSTIPLLKMLPDRLQKPPRINRKAIEDFFKRNQYVVINGPNFSILLVGVHLGVVAFVISGCNVIHPFLIFKIPLHSFLDAFFELK